MPFGVVSLGDLISLGLLVKDFIESLDSARGSSAEYQAIIRNLKSLSRVLDEAETVFEEVESSAMNKTTESTIKECIQSCRRCIKDFRDRICKYDNRLGKTQSKISAKGAVLRFKWTFDKASLSRFIAEINAYCNQLNILLTSFGIRRMSKIDLKSSQQVIATNKVLDGITFAESPICTSGSIKTDTQFQTNTERMAELNIESSGPTSPDIATMDFSLLCPSKLQSTLIHQQQYLMLDDPFGNLIPLHPTLVNSWEVFQNMLEAMFRQNFRYRKIVQKEYSLRVRGQTKCLTPSAPFSSIFFPGSYIEMGLVFESSNLTRLCCSNCGMSSLKIHVDEGSSRECADCGHRFSNTTRYRPKIKRSSYIYRRRVDISLIRQIRQGCDSLRCRLDSSICARNYPRRFCSCRKQEDEEIEGDANRIEDLDNEEGETGEVEDRKDLE